MAREATKLLRIAIEDRVDVWFRDKDQDVFRESAKIPEGQSYGGRNIHAQETELFEQLRENQLSVGSLVDLRLSDLPDLLGQAAPISSQIVLPSSVLVTGKKRCVVWLTLVSVIGVSFQQLRLRVVASATKEIQFHEMKQ